MMRFVLCVLSFVALSSASPSSPSHGSTVAPTPLTPVTSLCKVMDTPDVCQMKKTQCGFITKALSPPGGYIKTYVNCAKEAGVVLGSFFYTSISDAFKSGAPETIVEMTSPDPKVVTGIRRCAMNATGLVFPDMSLDRMAIANILVVTAGGSPLGYAVAAASASCSQPRSYRMADYLSCLKQACIKQLVLPTEPAPSPPAFSSQSPGSSS
ncbi:uncharacterized protein LOC119586449 isoform X2 [Penaeus monodon]|nr:uncharacterized protein LOC119586449 isoform X2 [Penaeus monodon]